MNGFIEVKVNGRRMMLRTTDVQRVTEGLEGETTSVYVDGVVYPYEAETPYDQVQQQIIQDRIAPGRRTGGEVDEPLGSTSAEVL